MWKIEAFSSLFASFGDRGMSFSRHEEIYRPMSSWSSTPRRSSSDRPEAHRYDEFPAGYSLAGCAPAEPAFASPAGAHRVAVSSGSTIEKQRTARSVLTACLTQGDNPTKDLDGYAFALGALAHYAADNEGHRIGVNRAVPVLYPKLKRKYGDSVTYEEGKLP